MIKFADRVKEVTYTTGTASFILSGTVTGYIPFGTPMVSGTHLFYGVTDGTNWEVGLGAYNSGPAANISRELIFSSSNSNNIVSFPSGIKEIFNTFPAAIALPTESYRNVFEDFTGFNAPFSGWTTSFAGTQTTGSSVGANSGIEYLEDASGVYSLTTGNTAAGRASLGDFATSLMFMSGTYTYSEYRVSIPTGTTAAQAFRIDVGFHSQLHSSTGDAVDGAYFTYHSGSSGNWQCVTASNSSRTTTTTGIAATQNFVKLEILVDQAMNDVRFTIDDVLVAVHTANIPTGLNRLVGNGIRIAKAVGTTARTFLIDYFKLFVIQKTPR